MDKTKINKTEYLVVGGGITGLMMLYCLKDKNVLLVEKDVSVGGYCRTIKRNGYIWDYAGHFFHFDKKEIRDFFQSAFSSEEMVFCKKNTGIWYKGSLIDYPFQKNIHQLPKNEFIDCLYDLFFRKKKKSYDNFLDMLYGKFGKSIVEKFLRPYNEKLYACSLEDLDADAMGRFFPNASLSDIVKNMKHSETSSYNDEFYYPKDGAEKFISVLTENSNKEDMVTETELVSVDLQERIATVKRKDRQYQLGYNILINTTPLNLFLKQTNSKTFFDLGDRLEYNKVLVFNIGFDMEPEKIFSDCHWIYFPDKCINFYRVGFYNNILNMDKMSIYCEIGFAKDAEIDLKKELSQTIKNLKEIGIITKHKIVDHEAVIMDPAYVYINERQNCLIHEVKKELEQYGVYSIGRYGAWKYCSMEDSMLDSVELQKYLCIKN